jgi:hypothetical protein
MVKRIWNEWQKLLIKYFAEFAEIEVTKYKW